MQMAISRVLLSWPSSKLQLWRLCTPSSRPRFLSSTSKFDGDLPPLDVSYPAFTVWGSNTNVGKTLVSAGLASSLISSGSNVLYVKPVQTGFPLDSDSDSVVRKVSQVVSNGVSARPRKVYVSNCVQNVSPAVLKARMEPEQEEMRNLPPHIKRISGMSELFRYKGYLLEANCNADGRWHTREAKPGEEYQLESSTTASTFIATTMWSWFHAVSPHLAVAQEGCSVTDSTLLQELTSSLSKFSQAVNSSEVVDHGYKKWAILETAGGVASPGPSGTLQCDLYRPLRLPGLLVGDGKLGGISSTITAYESLLIRGYDVDAIILSDCGLANEEQLLGYLNHRIPVLVLPSIPQDASDGLIHWYLQSGKVFSQLQQILERAYFEKIQRLQSMQKKAALFLWWPFTQHSHVSEHEITVIDSRSGDNFMIYKHAGESEVISQQVDACASWWTQGPNKEFQLELARQIGYAAGRFGHVMLPENVYEPALRCAELLIQTVGKGWADRVYYSDNGSTAIEIAIKMAFRKYICSNSLLSNLTSNFATIDKKYHLKVLALKGSYHGDTLGAQDAQSPSAYTGFLQQPWYHGRGFFF